MALGFSIQLEKVAPSRTRRPRQCVRTNMEQICQCTSSFNVGDAAPEVEKWVASAVKLERRNGMLLRRAPRTTVEPSRDVEHASYGYKMRKSCSRELDLAQQDVPRVAAAPR